MHPRAPPTHQLAAVSRQLQPAATPAPGARHDTASHSARSSALASAARLSTRGFAILPERNFDTHDDDTAPWDSPAIASLVAPHRISLRRNSLVYCSAFMRGSLALKC